MIEMNVHCIKITLIGYECPTDQAALDKFADDIQKCAANHKTGNPKVDPIHIEPFDIHYGG